MVKVKICGITLKEDALAAVEAGADAIGFNFYPGSPRYVSVATVASIAKVLPPFVVTVGLMVNEQPEAVNRLMDQAGLAVAQLHGDETAEHCASVKRPVLKAVRVRSEDDLRALGAYRVAAFLLDSWVPGLYGGTGERFPWELALKAKDYGRIILAGGLTVENVAEAVRQVRPYGVDVSTGVEFSPGRKDPYKIRKFIEEAKSAWP